MVLSSPWTTSVLPGPSSAPCLHEEQHTPERGPCIRNSSQLHLQAFREQCQNHRAGSRESNSNGAICTNVLKASRELEPAHSLPSSGVRIICIPAYKASQPSLHTCRGGITFPPCDSLSSHATEDSHAFLYPHPVSSTLTIPILQPQSHAVWTTRPRPVQAYRSEIHR
jgi:hypothetical protein